MSLRFLVTGGAGFIGSAVARHLVTHTSHVVTVFDKLTYAGSLAPLGCVATNSRFTFVKGDVCDAAAVRAAVQSLQPDIIMHLAAESHVDRSIDSPAAFVQTNIVGTQIVLDAALAHWRSLEGNARARFRFHQISTDEVFGTLGASGVFCEASPYAPNSPYAASKAAADHLVRAWRRTYGLPVVISNCSNNYGPWQNPEKFIPLMIINACERRALPVYGTGENARDWLHVDDHVEALLRIAQRGRDGETYLIGGDAERRNIDVAFAICDMLDEALPQTASPPRRELVTLVEDRPGHDLRYAVGHSKLTNELGWMPRETFESGLRKAVRWYLENRSWWQKLRTGERPGTPQRKNERA